MIKYILILITLFTLPLMANTPSVLVSVAPHKFFVERIAGTTVNTLLMVPAGASSHTYEPTPKQMLMASQADIWFCIGESFEKRASASMTAYRPQMEIVDLRQGLNMITVDPLSGCRCCHADCQDLHIWLSAREAKIQAKTIADTLTRHYPEHAAQYESTLAQFTKELDLLDQEITSILQPLQQRIILVSHPAYAYFCRDYNLVQLSIEFEGKDPTPQQMTKILNQARSATIKRIFIQAQYPSKGAHLFGKELNAKVVLLDPYSEHYPTSMLEIARQFALSDTL